MIRVCILLAALLLISPLAGAEQPDRPNIIILLADDLGWRDVGYQGSEIKTPHIDRLAAEGVQLRDFYAMSFCTPSRAGLLTGRWPIRYGLMHRVVWPWTEDGLPPEEVTMAEYLARLGYQDRVVIGKWHLGHGDKKYHPLNQGFTHFVGAYNGGLDYYSRKISGQRDWHEDFAPSPPEAQTDDYATFDIANHAVKAIRENKGGSPLFLYVAFTAPHRPNQAPASYLDQYEAWPDPIKASHAAMVTALDDAIGQILAAVDDQGMRDNTIILFLSDNGGATYFGASNRPYRGQKGLSYEGGIRVPAITRWPAAGWSGGRVVHGRMGYIDILPTILDAVDQPIPQLDGQSVFAAIDKGQPIAGRDWFTFRGSDDDEMLSVASGRWKLIRRGATVLQHDDGQISLFDLRTDPYERYNLAQAEPEVVNLLLQKMQAFRALETTGKTRDAFDGAAQETRRWHLSFRKGEAHDGLNEPIPGFTAPENWRVGSLKAVAQ